MARSVPALSGYNDSHALGIAAMSWMFDLETLFALTQVDRALRALFHDPQRTDAVWFRALRMAMNQLLCETRCRLTAERAMQLSHHTTLGLRPLLFGNGGCATTSFTWIDVAVFFNNTRITLTAGRQTSADDCCIMVTPRRWQDPVDPEAFTIIGPVRNPIMALKILLVFTAMKSGLYRENTAGAVHTERFSAACMLLDMADDAELDVRYLPYTEQGQAGHRQMLSRRAGAIEHVADFMRIAMDVLRSLVT